MPTKPKRHIPRLSQEGTPTMAHPFIEEEYIKGIAAVKNNKAVGLQPPDNPQVTAFHPRNKENVTGEMEQDISGEHPHSKYLGVKLDRTLGYKQHIHNTKIRVATRNNLLRKLTSSKWGTNTLRTTALALGYSVAEFAAPVWARSAYAHKLDSELNSACRTITGSIKPTSVCWKCCLQLRHRASDEMCARVEKDRQETNEVHSLYGKNPSRDTLEI